MKTTVMADAFKKAKEKKGNDGNGSLPDLTQIQVQELTEEEIIEREKKVQDRKQWAEGAAQKLTSIRERIAQLKRLAMHGVLTQEDKNEIAYLTELKTKILSAGDEELQKHVQFAEFLEEIRNAVPHKELAKKFLNQVVAEGRYRFATEEEINQIRHDKKWPQGTIFFEGKIYLSVFPEEEKSAGQRAIESELGKYIKEVKKMLAKERKSKTDEIKNISVKNLTLFKQRETGLYRLEFQEREDENGRKWKAGMGLIEIQNHGDKSFLVIVVKKGCGSLSWLNEYTEKWIPFSWFVKNQIPDSALEEIRELGKRIIKTIRAALAAYYSTK